MREVVFKGKRTDNGEWVEGAYMPHYYSTRYGKVAAIFTNDDVLCKTYRFPVDPETVGQYTGKVVKTGKVFDGDIGKSIDGIFLVYWDDEKAAFVLLERRDHDGGHIRAARHGRSGAFGRIRLCRRCDRHARGQDRDRRVLQRSRHPRALLHGRGQPPRPIEIPRARPL